MRPSKLFSIEELLIVWSPTCVRNRLPKPSPGYYFSSCHDGRWPEWGTPPLPPHYVLLCPPVLCPVLLPSSSRVVLSHSYIWYHLVTLMVNLFPTGSACSLVSCFRFSWFQQRQTCLNLFVSNKEIFLPLPFLRACMKCLCSHLLF